MSSIRTIGDLIAELRKWPETGRVSVCMSMEPNESGFVVGIVSVNGYAGSAIDGHDCGVTIAIDQLPTRESGTKSRRTAKS